MNSIFKTSLPCTHCTCPTPTILPINRGTMTIDEGAKSSVHAALLPPKTDIRGEFIHDDCSVKDWVTFRFKFEPSMMKPAPEEAKK